MKGSQINIQYALSQEGEYKILGVGKVDGFCHETNTVYEFHGAYYHGDPRKYAPDEVNPTLHLTYGELYQRTIKRDEKIRELGFNLVTKWEFD